MKIGIIGGGASGIMAALSASDNLADITVFERKDRIGKKLLVTGNGKCNYTNEKMGCNFYYCDDPEFVLRALSNFDNSSVVSFFKRLGVLSKIKNGYVYPLSEQASTVVEALEYELKEKNISVKLNTNVINVEKNDSDNTFSVIDDSGKRYSFDKIIISSGGKSSLSKNEISNGYNLCRNLGHSLTKIYPALTSLKCSGIDFKSVSGVRCDCNLALYVNDELTMEDNGEVLINDGGISGIVTFQVSHCAIENAREGNNTYIILDTLPGMSIEDIDAFVDLKYLTYPNLTLEEFVTGLCNKKLCLMALNRFNLNKDARTSDFSIEEIKNCIRFLKSINVSVKPEASFDKSQVTGGGIPLNEVKDSFESIYTQGLFITGELLNVDGICGGYNLQWAFTSGHIAGQEASKI